MTETRKQELFEEIKSYVSTEFHRMAKDLNGLVIPRAYLIILEFG